MVEGITLPVGAARPSAGLRYGLTPRQIEVFEAIASGLSTRATADALGITKEGVKWHMRLILQKTKCRNRKELKVRMGLIADNLEGSCGQVSK